MSALENIGKEKMPSILSDPFSKKGIKSITTHSYKGYNEEWRFTGSVEFENNNTSGKQKFDGSSFDDVVLKMKAFFESL